MRSQGDDATHCAQERGSGYLYAGIQWRRGDEGDTCVGDTCRVCTCAGTNAKVRIGVGPDMEYKGCYVDGGRDLDIMELSGDAHFDGDFGLTLDGMDDFATVTDPPDIMSRGSFTVAFWMTKTMCTIPSWWET